MDDRQEIMDTLSHAEELVRELQGQVEAESECAASILKLIEARSILDRAGMLILDRYLEDCLADPAQMDSERLLRALELFFRMMPAMPYAAGARGEKTQDR